MENATTIEGFNALMSSQREDASIFGTLRAICAIEQPEVIRQYKTAQNRDGAPTPDASWGGWAF